MAENTKITDAARAVAYQEYEDLQAEPGFYVQQLLNAEREKWEKEALPDLLGHPATKENIAAFEAHHTATEDVAKGFKSESDQLRQQLLEAQEKLKIQAQEQLHSIHAYAALREELLEAQAAIAVKDEALKQAFTFNELGTDREGDEIKLCSICNSDITAGHKDSCLFNQALSPNCGQPLLELVREMVEALKLTANRAYSIGNNHGHHDTVEAQFIPVYPKDETTYYSDKVDEMVAENSLPEMKQALTKAKQLGF